MLQSIIFSILLSLDAFSSSMAYGINKIKIPFLSTVIISIISEFFLLLSFILSYYFKEFTNKSICLWLSFILLFILGIYNLLCTLIRNKLKVKDFKFSISGINIMIKIYIDEIEADLDNSKVLNYNEALFLGIALSVDSLATGFSIGLGNVSYLFFLIIPFIMNIISILLGQFIGKKIGIKFNLSYLNGIILIFISLLKLIDIIIK